MIRSFRDFVSVSENGRTFPGLETLKGLQEPAKKGSKPGSIITKVLGSFQNGSIQINTAEFERFAILTSLPKQKAQ